MHGGKTQVNPSERFIRFVGISELLGVLGIVVSVVTGDFQSLAISGGGLTLIQILASSLNFCPKRNTKFCLLISCFFFDLHADELFAGISMNNNFGQWFMDGGHVIVGLTIILISTCIHFALVKERNWRLAAELLLMYSMGVSGFKGIFGGFVMHYFFADEMARSIGWTPGNPFQTEVAFFNLAVGILGALTFFRRDFWLPFIIVSTVMGWGAGFVHLTEMIEHGNFAGNNAGPILYADILMPILRIVLYFIYHRNQKGNKHG